MAEGILPKTALESAGKLPKEHPAPADPQKTYRRSAAWPIAQEQRTVQSAGKLSRRAGFQCQLHAHRYHGQCGGHRWCQVDIAGQVRLSYELFQGGFMGNQWLYPLVELYDNFSAYCLGTRNTRFGSGIEIEEGNQRYFRLFGEDDDRKLGYPINQSPPRRRVVETSG